MLARFLANAGSRDVIPVASLYLNTVLPLLSLSGPEQEM
jgi:hypothetical protein